MKARVSKRQLKENRELSRANRTLRRLGFFPVTWASREGHIWVESGHLSPKPFEVCGSNFDEGIRASTATLRKETLKAMRIKRRGPPASTPEGAR